MVKHITQDRMCPCISNKSNNASKSGCCFPSALFLQGYDFLYHCIRHHHLALVPRTAEVPAVASWSLGSVALQLSVSMRAKAGTDGDDLRAFIFAAACWERMRQCGE